MDWLNNPWVIGIGGGILSGLLVTFISRIILSRRDSGEYTQKLLSANREIVYALRPGVSEGYVPDRRVVIFLINATARKYSVDTGDLFDPAKIGEELAKEIMDSSFISASTKQEYCKQLTPLTTVPAELVGETADASAERAASRSDLASYRARMVAVASVMLGTTAAMMTMVLTVSDGFGDANATVESFDLLVPSGVALLATVMAAAMMLVRRRLPRRRSEGGLREGSRQNSDTDHV